MKPGPVEQGPDLVLAWSPDGALLAATRGKMLEVWGVRGATLRASLDVGDPPPHNLAWSPNGARLAYWTPGTVARIWFWEVKDDAARLDLQPCVDVAFGRDGSWVRCSVEGDHPVELYDVGTGVRLSDRAASERLVAFGETFVQAPRNAPHLVRISDRRAIGFHRVRREGFLFPVAVTDEGLFMGDREAAAQVILRQRPDKKLLPLPAEALSSRELRTLLSDFVADRRLPPVLVPADERWR